MPDPTFKLNAGRFNEKTNWLCETGTSLNQVPIIEASMSEFTTTVTQRGQVTIPVAVRRFLGVEPSDRVTFTIEGGEVRLSPAAFTVETAFGSVEHCGAPGDLEDFIRQAKDAKAEATSQELICG